MEIIKENIIIYRSLTNSSEIRIGHNFLLYFAFELGCIELFLTTCLFAVYFRLPGNHIDKILIELTFWMVAEIIYMPATKVFFLHTKKFPCRCERSVWLISTMNFYHTLSFHLQKTLESLVGDVSVTTCKNEKVWSLFTA